MKQRYDLPELIKRWEREQMTVEQMVGQILLWLVALSERLARLEAAGRKAEPLSRPPVQPDAE